MLCREIHDINGKGDQVLSTLGIELIRFQIETVEEMNGGAEIVSDSNCADDLGSFLYVFLWDLRIPTSRNKSVVCKKRQQSGRQENARRATEGG